MWRDSAFEGLKSFFLFVTLCAFRMDGSSSSLHLFFQRPLRPSICPSDRPPSLPEHSSFALHVLGRQKPQQLDSHSFTNIKYTNSCKGSATCLYLSVKKRVDFFLRVSLGDVQGTEMFLLFRMLRQHVHLLILHHTEVNVWTEGHGEPAVVRCSTPSCCP